MGERRFRESGDYWKLTKDGKLKYDGSGWLHDELGRTIKDKNGKDIGANGVETGLVNILLGRVAQNDDETRAVQDLMVASGLQHTGDSSTDPTKWAWNLKANANTEINLGQAMNNWGNSMVSAVFASYYNTTADMQIAKTMGKNIGEFGTSDVASSVAVRYADLVNSKTAFYSGMQSSVDLNKGYQIPTNGDFADYDSSLYKDFDHYHYGLDLTRVGAKGDPIYSGLAGIVDAKGWNTQTNGNDLRIEYAYLFEGNAIGTGIYGEYLHMKEPSLLKPGDYSLASTLIGNLGGTGSHSTGPHLHYDMFTIDDAYNKSTAAYVLGSDYRDNVLNSNNKYWLYGNVGGTKRVYDPKAYYKTQWNYTFPGSSK
jgi:murein DD-endopeptidase MepM/ murein hydrolase activator NlpD